MKKLTCLLSVISVFLAFQAVSNADTSDDKYVHYRNVQHRLYESGLEIYRIQFMVQIQVGASQDPQNDPYYDGNIKKVILGIEPDAGGPYITYEFDRDHTV